MQKITKQSTDRYLKFLRLSGITIILSFSFILFVATGKPIIDCKCNDIPLYGRVKVVENHPDFRVKIVEHHADLQVKKVNYHSKTCGDWYFVENHPDFTVKFVDSHEDFTIKFR